MTRTKTALILGTTGGIGGELAAALGRHGWQINGLHRNPAQAGGRNGAAGIRWIQGDALNPPDVIEAARGASLIVHAVNPPGLPATTGSPRASSNLANPSPPSRTRVAAVSDTPGLTYLILPKP